MTGATRVSNPFVEAIVAEVAFAHAVTPEDVFSLSRTSTVVRARRAAMAAARDRHGFSYPELGRFFGRDSSSVMNLVKGGKKR